MSASPHDYLCPIHTTTAHACAAQAENEANVAYALKKFPRLRLSPQPLILGSPGLAGYGLSPEQCALVQRFEPDGLLDTIGFFIARFEYQH